MTLHVEQLSDDIALYLGDCREILPTLGKVDAVVTDPPYGIRGKDAESRHDSANQWKQHGVLEWDHERPSRAVFDLLRACSDDQIIWGGNYFSDVLPVSMQWLVWDKGQRNFSLADVELAWSSQQKAARAFTYARGMESGIGPRADAFANSHPTQKPLAVMIWCLKRLPVSARLIVDPFMGSGTTGVAAVQLGLKFTGIEIEPKYFDIACQRVSQALKQPSLFIEKPAPAEQIGLDLGHDQPPMTK